MFASDDTICAIASPPGGGIRGIVRLSGPDSLRILANVVSAGEDFPTQAKRITRSIDLGPPLGDVDASILVWPTHRSYTGMPSAEIQLPGATPILNAALQTLLNSGARLAQPGEFTMRAFLAGQLDLTAAEAVLGVIDAEDKRSLDIALRQLSGGLSQPLHLLRTELLNLLAHLEAGLDFAEEDIEFISMDELRSKINRIREQVVCIRDQMQFREGGSALSYVVLRGEPNAGKSSLINALSGTSIAIVSDLAGTTRDRVEEIVDLGDMRVRLADTAGVETGKHEVAIASQSAGESAHRDADLILLCVDLTRESMTAWERETLNANSPIPLVLVGTKADQVCRLPLGTEYVVRTSSATGLGIQSLRDEIEQRLLSIDRVESAATGSTSVRCQASLDDAMRSIDRAIESIDGRLGEELVACEIRIALDALGQVTGVVYTDDILDRIFSQFCIGK